jgi:hypothetical protein
MNSAFLWVSRKLEKGVLLEVPPPPFSFFAGNYFQRTHCLCDERPCSSIDDIARKRKIHIILHRITPRCFSDHHYLQLHQVFNDGLTPAVTTIISHKPLQIILKRNKQG